MSVRTDARLAGRAIGAVVILACLMGCASAGPDPLGRFNRPAFAINDGLDRYVLEPASKGWAWITPEVLRTSLDKLVKNLRFPVRFLSSLGQGEPRQAGEELRRFLLNTTLGVLGLFDPATHFGLENFDADFGQMLGRWGVPPGPYLVLPILTPGGTSPRRVLDLVANSFLPPLPWSLIPLINGRAIVGPQVARAREASLDFYVSVRDAYVKQRAALVRDVDPDEEELYDLPEEFYDDPEEPER